MDIFQTNSEILCARNTDPTSWKINSLVTRHIYGMQEPSYSTLPPKIRTSNSRYKSL